MERVDAFDGQLDRVAHRRIDRYFARYDEDLIDRDSIKPLDLLAHERIAARANASDHLARHTYGVLIRSAAPRFELAKRGFNVIAQHSPPPLLARSDRARSSAPCDRTFSRRSAAAKFPRSRPATPGDARAPSRASRRDPPRATSASAPPPVPPIHPAARPRRARRARRETAA